MTDQYLEAFTLTDATVGDTGPSVVVEDLGVEDFVRYAGASGDFNPMHYDESFATAAGSEGVFGQGMLTAGILSHMVHDWFGLQNLRSFTTRFEDRVWPGDTLTATGEIIRIDSETGVVEADIWVENQDGEQVVTGSSVAEPPR